jgi:simple sugar transport system ATP-binding protein
VEILKALYRGAEILILDEPTGVLTPQEAQELFEIVNSLKAEGKSIIFISHKLNEVLEIADRITVLRRGRRSRRFPARARPRRAWRGSWWAATSLLRVSKAAAQPGEPLLTVEGPSGRRRARSRVCRGVSFQVRAGEIVGIAGVDGNGQSELIDAITGCARRGAARSASGTRM